MGVGSTLRAYLSSSTHGLTSSLVFADSKSPNQTSASATSLNDAHAAVGLPLLEPLNLQLPGVMANGEGKTGQILMTRRKAQGGY